MALFTGSLLSFNKVSGRIESVVDIGFDAFWAAYFCGTDMDKVIFIVAEDTDDCTIVASLGL